MITLNEIKTAAKIIAKYHNPASIILFGSYATGTAGPESDIDLIVVEHTKGMSNTYREMLNRRLKYADAILPLIPKAAVDLLVYTQDEWKSLETQDNTFIREIHEQGISLL
jgi:predicted nucleotidyltransferase